MAADDARPFFEEEAKARQREHAGTAPGKPKTLVENVPPVKEEPTKARDAAASIFGVSGRYVDDARLVKQQAPEEADAVKRGESFLLISRWKKNTMLQKWHNTGDDGKEREGAMLIRLPRHTTSIVVAVVVLGVGSIFAQRSISAKRIRHQEEQAKAAHEQETKQAVANMALRFNAVTDWSKDLVKDRRGDILFKKVFTVEVQEALTNFGDNPLLIYVSLTDIRKSNNGYAVTFENCGRNYIFGYLPKMYWDLRLSSERVPELSRLSKENAFSVFSVIATVERVEPRSFIENDSEEDSGAIKSGVLVSGKCLDFIYRGGDFSALLSDE